CRREFVVMNLSTYELFAIASAIAALLMLGTTHIRFCLRFYSLHTLLIAAATLAMGRLEGHYLYMGLSDAGLKALFVPLCLSVICRRINVQSDSTTFLPAPICMHVGIALLGVSYLISAQMPGVIAGTEGRIGATAAFSLIFGGIMMMLTRRVAI